MYKYHDFVYNYAVDYAAAPQHMPIPAIPYVKDAITNMIEKQIRQTIPTPAYTYAFETPEITDYTVFDPKAYKPTLIDDTAISETANVMKLSA
jgi:hypothetical protein